MGITISGLSQPEPLVSTESAARHLGGEGSALLTKYETYCRASGMRPSTIQLRLMWLRRIARTIDLETATFAELIGWLGSHDWQPETRKSARNAMRSFYRWAMNEGVLPTDPSSRLPAVRVPTGVPNPAPTDLLQVALAAASPRDALLISLAAFAGLRRSEIASLPWSAVTWAGLHVVGKGGRSRTVPLLPKLAVALQVERRMRERGEVGEGYRYDVDPYSPFVFPSHTIDHMSSCTVGLILSRALGHGWTGHSLRHRFATLAYGVDRDLLTVQQLLGHSKPETTARYTAVPSGAAAAAVAGVAA